MNFLSRFIRLSFYYFLFQWSGNSLLNNATALLMMDRNIDVSNVCKRNRSLIVQLDLFFSFVVFLFFFFFFALNVIPTDHIKLALQREVHDKLRRVQLFSCERTAIVFLFQKSQNQSLFANLSTWQNDRDL